MLPPGQCGFLSDINCSNGCYKITIIGHSLNDYDIEALNLIIDAIKSNEKVPSLFIADPAAEEIRDKIFSKTSKKPKDFKEVCLFDCFEYYLKK